MPRIHSDRINLSIISLLNNPNTLKYPVLSFDSFVAIFLLDPRTMQSIFPSPLQVSEPKLFFPNWKPFIHCQTQKKGGQIVKIGGGILNRLSDNDLLLLFCRCPVADLLSVLCLAAYAVFLASVKSAVDYADLDLVFVPDNPLSPWAKSLRHDSQMWENKLNNFGAKEQKEKAILSNSNNQFICGQNMKLEKLLSIVIIDNHCICYEFLLFMRSAKCDWDI